MPTYIDEVDISHKKVLLRVDFNVTMNPDHSIADDLRIRQTIPTIQHLLERNNTVILVTHLGNPQGTDQSLSLSPLVADIEKHVKVNVVLVEDFTTFDFSSPEKKLYLLENIRFHTGEKNGDEQFAKKLSSIAEVYVNDAFGVSHRADTSVVLIPKLLPSYGGLLLKKEVETLQRLIDNPEHPFTAIIGGAKISTKLHLLDKLIEIADELLVGGALANTLLAAQGNEIGQSLIERSEIENAKRMLQHAKTKQTTIVLPIDVVTTTQETKDVMSLASHDVIGDIGPKTQSLFSESIKKAKTIVWNGPLGKFEDNHLQNGTRSVLEAIVSNTTALSVVGGGETITALSHESHLSNITHISTGGGAMLEFIEKGTLPGIQALG